MLNSTKSHQFIITGGKLQHATTEDHIRWCIKSLLSLQQGELSSQPELGADLMSMMFRRDAPAFRHNIILKVANSLAVGEKRIEVEETQILSEESAPDALSVQIRYRIIESQRVETLKVFI